MPLSKNVPLRPLCYSSPVLVISAATLVLLDDLTMLSFYLMNPTGDVSFGGDYTAKTVRSVSAGEDNTAKTLR